MKTDVPRRSKPQVTRREAAGGPLHLRIFLRTSVEESTQDGTEKKRAAGERKSYLSLIGNFFVDTIFAFVNCDLFIEE